MSGIGINANPRLAKLVENIGAADAAELIQKALPIIIERRSEMDRFLAANDLENASACAHKTLGSVRLYGSPELERLLKQVKTLNVGQGDLTTFQSQLSDAFSRVIASCDYLIKK